MTNLKKTPAQSARNTRKRSVEVYTRSGAHLRALQELRAGPVVSAPIRKWLIRALDNWAKRGSPIAGQTDTQSSLNNPKCKESKEIWRFVLQEPRIKAAEYAISLYQFGRVGKFEAALSDALEWARKKFPNAKVSRSNLAPECAKLKAMGWPVPRPEHFEGTETEEQAAEYDAKWEQFREEVELSRDPLEVAEEQKDRETCNILEAARWFGVTCARQISPKLSASLTNRAIEDVTMRRHRVLTPELVESLGDALMQGLLEELSKTMAAEVAANLSQIVKSNSNPENLQK